MKGKKKDKMEELKDKLQYEHKVQYYETDQMRIVHHSNYIRWFEEARTGIFEKIGAGYNRMENIGILSPVLEVSAKYRSMTRYAEVVQIQMKVKAYNGIRISLEYVICDKESGEVKCTGESRHCFIDREGKLVCLSKAWPEGDELIKGIM